MTLDLQYLDTQLIAMFNNKFFVYYFFDKKVKFLDREEVVLFIIVCMTANGAGGLRGSRVEGVSN